MPAVVRSEFALALNQIASERGVSVETILSTIEEALIVAYRKDRALSGEAINIEEFTASVNPDTGEAAIFRRNADGNKGENITPPGFGRIAAQTAGQVLRQKIREAEKKAVLADFSQKVGTIISGMVLRFDGPNVVVDVGRTEAILPPPEQNPAERYHLNQRLTFYIKEIRETARGQEIIVSRSDERLVTQLLRKEVPEHQSNAVEVRLIAREAGGRTKLAVASRQSGVDPVGASVGQKGVRIQAVISEVGNNEKVDVIQYSDDQASLIASSLAPAKEVEVVLNEKNHTATAYVLDDQLSLAIGREGQNARLAAKLTGWRIDIKKKSEKKSAADQLKEDEEKKEKRESVSGIEKEEKTKKKREKSKSGATVKVKIKKGKE